MSDGPLMNRFFGGCRSIYEKALQIAFRRTTEQDLMKTPIFRSYNLMETGQTIFYCTPHDRGFVSWMLIKQKLIGKKKKLFI